MLSANIATPVMKFLGRIRHQDDKFEVLFPVAVPDEGWITALGQEVVTTWFETCLESRGFNKRVTCRQAVLKDRLNWRAKLKLNSWEQIQQAHQHRVAMACYLCAQRLPLTPLAGFGIL